MKYLKLIMIVFLGCIASVNYAQDTLVANCEFIRAVESGDTTLIPTESVYLAVDRQTSTDSITDWSIAGFNESILLNHTIQVDTLLLNACYAEYNPVGAGTGYRYITHLDNVRSIRKDGTRAFISLKRPWRDISITGTVDALVTRWTAWKTAQYDQ